MRDRIDLVLDLVRLGQEVDRLQTQLLSTTEEFDATDGAHPCWWRGHDNGARGMEAKLKKQHARELSELRAHYEAELAIARGAVR